MKLLKYIFVILCLCSLSSCKSFFEQTPDNMLNEDDNYTDRSNIYSSFMGLLSTIQDAADDLIVLSELRGDLVSPTDLAPDDFWEVFRYSTTPDNKVINPSSLYRIVMNCNDFLRHTVEYNKNYPGVIPVNTYRQLISGAVTMRAWAYMTIGKLYGEAAYYDYAMTGEVDLSKIESMKFDRLIPELIYFMSKGVDNINGLRRVDIDNMFGVEGTIWRRMSISPDALMCELYLWNKDYEAAAKRGINLLTGHALLDAGNNNNLTLSYQFGNEKKKGLKPWYTLWSEVPVQVHTNEALTVIMYDFTQRQNNSLQYLCSSTPPNVYHLKPTQNLLDKFTGDDYRDGLEIVADCRGENVTFGTEMGNSVIYKYHCDKRPFYLTDAPIYIYRAAEIHLMIAEALTALGNLDAADAILNEGFADYNVAGDRFSEPFEAPIYAYTKLAAGRGVRGRVQIPIVKSKNKRFMTGYTPGTPEYTERRRIVLDSLIVEETAREFAMEGKRWFTLVRMARNQNKPEMLADLVCKKFPESDRETYRNMLLDSRQWFINYDLKLDNK